MHMNNYAMSCKQGNPSVVAVRGKGVEAGDRGLLLHECMHHCINECCMFNALFVYLG